MSIEIKVPPLPESVTDATLVAWHRKAGESVRRDENLVDLETDKVVLEVPAPSDGVLKEVLVEDGTVVTSGDVLAILEPGAVEAAEPAAEASPEPREGPARQAGEAVQAAEPAAEESPKPQEERPEQAAEAAQAAAPGLEGEAKMGPAVRALIEEHDLDASSIRGSGREGRITKGDVLEYLSEHRATSVGIESDTRLMAALSRAEHRVGMTRLRARIAERLVEAQQTAAMLTTFNEVDMSAIIDLRNRYREEFMERHGIKLGFMSFFVRASVEALREHPIVNASVDGTEIVYHEYFDIGVAVSTDRGLLVPVLRDAQNMSFADIEKGIADYGKRARTGEIEIEELTGGTFTITNGGIFGSMLSTPILNPPQSGILGMHAIEERPVVVDGEIVARPMMYIALTYDHRIIDGRDAVRFLVYLKQQLEDPARLILQI